MNQNWKPVKKAYDLEGIILEHMKRLTLMRPPPWVGKVREHKDFLWFGGEMSKASVDLKVYPETRDNLRTLAALQGCTMALTLDRLIGRELRRIFELRRKRDEKKRTT